MENNPRISRDINGLNIEWYKGRGLIVILHAKCMILDLPNMVVGSVWNRGCSGSWPLVTASSDTALRLLDKTPICSTTFDWQAVVKAMVHVYTEMPMMSSWHQNELTSSVVASFSLIKRDSLSAITLLSRAMDNAGYSFSLPYVSTSLAYLV